MIRNRKLTHYNNHCPFKTFEYISKNKLNITEENKDEEGAEIEAEMRKMRTDFFNYTVNILHCFQVI